MKMSYTFSTARKKEEIIEVEQVASLKGHYGHVISVAWSTHFDCKLASTSADGSVQIWDVIAQAPLVNFSSIQKPNLSIWSPVDPDIILTGCHNGVLSTWKVSKQKKTLPLPLQKIKKPKKAKETPLTVAKEITEDHTASNETAEPFSSSIIIAESKNIEVNAKEMKIFSKAWKSNANQNFSKCYNLLKKRLTNDECSEDLEFSLPFFESNDRCQELIALEEKSLKSSNNWTEYYELSLWNGKIKEVIEENIKSGHLNDFLVSLAPTVSFRLWQEACLAYSKTLTENKMFHKAATYLIGCHKIYEGINLLMDENLYLEAFYIAKSRLPTSDPILEEIIRRYAQRLFKTGSFLKACECYIYLKDYLEVAKICGKKSEPEYLSLAALAARKCDLDNLEIIEATNALFKCFELFNFELGRRICDDHDNLKHLKLLLCTYETIYQLDNEELKLDSADILSFVIKSIKFENVSFPSCLPLFYQHHKVYKNKQEMLIVVAQELSLAISCKDEKEKMLTHIIKALCTSCRFVQSSESENDFLFKLYSWLFPKQKLSIENYLDTNQLVSSAKVDSLKEFVGAAIVRHLNSHPIAENILSWMDTLNELENCFLKEDSFKYFKNLIEVGICEKKLMSTPKIIKMENEVATQMDGGEIEISKALESKNKEEEEINKSLFIDNDKIIKSNQAIISSSKSDSDFSENNKSTDIFSDRIECGEKSSEDFLQNKELLHKLKNEILSFQNSKISAPNPMPVFFMLKKLCEIVPESQTAQNLILKLENKWLKLNKI